MAKQKNPAAPGAPGNAGKQTALPGSSGQGKHGAPIVAPMIPANPKQAATPSGPNPTPPGPPPSGSDFSATP